MFQTYAAAPLFHSMHLLDDFDRERVCYSGAHNP